MSLVDIYGGHESSNEACCGCAIYSKAIISTFQDFALKLFYFVRFGIDRVHCAKPLEP